MLNNGSVMNGLHKISGKIAEASRPPVSASAHTEKSRIDSPAATPAVHGGEIPPTPAAAPVPPAMIKVPEPSKTSGSILGDALLRRYEDFLKTRRDLAVRIVRETEKLHIRQEELQRESERIRTSLELLEKFAETTAGTDESVNPGNQTVFAAEYRKIEHIRLELFRIAEQTNAITGTKGSGEKHGTADSLLPLLESLSFGQLAKAGFSFFFPFLVTLILSSLLLAAAIILSFNGMFVW